MDKAELMRDFHRIFGHRPENPLFLFAPGRINIIGEHIDYNGGLVMPMAINFGTYAMISRRDDGVARFASVNFPEIIEVGLQNIKYDAQHGWANYPKGIIYHMMADGHTLGGFDILFSGNIPQGAGLSSSASVEMVMAMAANAMFGLGYSPIEMALLAQKSENQFCGVNCGIMDQFAVGMGKKGHALMLNCDSLEYHLLPLNLGGHTIVVMDTKKSRQLSESAYNQRRGECEEALARLKPIFDVQNLADIAPENMDKVEELLGKGVLLMRARHVISENARVKQGAKLLEKGDVAALGQLLVASHKSLALDYEVSCAELDAIVEAALAHPACIGARMTGAGFGGCAIALVQQDNIDNFAKFVSEKYATKIGHLPEIYPVQSGQAEII
ncbi:MAG: galactokinase [Defluviitaleaceae bacterium]|nr:galactokinase [Defluviitaleaceae bacterium]